MIPSQLSALTSSRTASPSPGRLSLPEADFTALMGRLMGPSGSGSLAQLSDTTGLDTATSGMALARLTPGTSTGFTKSRWLGLRQSVNQGATSAGGGQADPAKSTASAAPASYESLIQSAAARHGLDPALVRAVVAAESSFNAGAVSPVGAQGLMQLMPGTAADLGVSDPFDPAQNIEGGTRYLKMMLERFDGDQDKALAAYNWGPGNVERGGSYPSETRNYIAKVTTLARNFAGSHSAVA